MFNIRYADEKDAKTLGKIHATSWKIAYKGIIPDRILDNITEDKREKYFQKALLAKLEEDAIIYEDNEATGFITLGKCRDKDKPETYGEVWGIYLAPQFWHAGMGTKLINWGLEELRKRGYKKATLWVLEDNVSAIRFYEKMGFKHDGTVRKIKIGKEINECRYEINL